MKYERLTKRTEHGEVLQLTTRANILDRLAELEDKIESGELGDTKQAVKEFASELKEDANALKCGSDESEAFIIGFRIAKELLLDKIDDLITELYGADEKEQEE